MTTGRSMSFRGGGDCNHNSTTSLGDEVGGLIGALLFRQFLG
jgi:hypothetical protein